MEEIRKMNRGEAMEAMRILKLHPCLIDANIHTLAQDGCIRKRKYWKNSGS